MFWTEVQQAFAGGPESDELRTESELWERTAVDGLEPFEVERGRQPVGRE